MVDAFRPHTLEEALKMRSQNKVLLYAGGTDCMVHPNSLLPFLFIGHLEVLKEIREEDTHYAIGSGCTYKELINSPFIPEILKMAAREVASPAIRNVGTIGGNICNASPAGDMLPILYALHASVKLTSLHSQRVIKIEDFITAPKQTVMNRDEILETIIVPKQSFNKVYYKKVGARKADAISKLSFAGLIELKGDRIKDLRIALGAVAPTVVKDRRIESQYIGWHLTELLHQKKVFLDRYEALIKPIDDQRSTAAYRKKTSLRLIEDFLVSSSVQF